MGLHQSFRPRCTLSLPSITENDPYFTKRGPKHHKIHHLEGLLMLGDVNNDADVMFPDGVTDAKRCVRDAALK